MFRVYCDSSKNVDLIILDSQLCTNTAANIPTNITQTVTAHLAMDHSGNPIFTLTLTV